MNSPRALSCWVQPGKVESVGVHELVLEGESRSSWQIFLEERGSQVEGYSKCKLDSEVRGHTASGHGQPGRSGGASLCGSETKDRLWPQDSTDQTSAMSSLSQPLSVSLHQISSQAGAKKYQLGDL